MEIIFKEIFSIVEPIVKLILSIAIGTLIGRERKKSDKPGGSRTFSMICFGACLIAMLSLKLADFYSLNYQIVRYDIGRLLAYGIVSITFLGSGFIRKREDHVDGLTTASTLWVMVPIGYCIGLGFYVLGIISSIFSYLILESKKKLPED